MKTKTGFLALGLFAIAGATIVDCGGSSDDSGDGTGTSGKGGSTTSTAGTTSSTAGSGTATAGTSSGGTTGTAGTGSNTAGTATTAGTGTGGNATAGRGNAGGDNGNNNAGGDNGNGGPPACAAGTMTGGMCTRAMGRGAQNSCTQADDSICTCQAGQGPNAMATWRCRMNPVLGAGGDNGGFGQATCPANAKDGDACTGTGLCTGQRCFCANDKANCF